MKCIYCGGFIVVERNVCMTGGNRTIVVDTIYECENGHKFTKKDKHKRRH